MRFRYKVDVAVILEPRISGSLARKTIKNWGFKFSEKVEAVGFSGGIWILWNLEDLVVDVLEKDDQFIHCRWFLNGKSMLFTAVYANPWDFNEIKSPSEQIGGGRINETRCRKFSDWIQNCGLIDVEANGPFFTWKGPKWEGLDRVFKRLDRCLCNVGWLEEFVDAEVRIVPRVGSDHHPMLVKLCADSNNAGVKNFRYEVMWQMHDKFAEFMRNSWKTGEEFHEMLNVLQSDLKKWNRDVFGKIEYRKKRSRTVNGIQQCTYRRSNPFLCRLEKNLEVELQQLLRQEEIFQVSLYDNVKVILLERMFLIQRSLLNTTLKMNMLMASLIDDNDIDSYPSPVPNSGVVIEEIVDDDKPEKVEIMLRRS
ncbi:hypothetical protein K1719_038429 [Acacia pycnantha]|nr:hypothetical protein K1719_038429 [Acacia pycnantha]